MGDNEIGGVGRFHGFGERPANDGGGPRSGPGAEREAPRRGDRVELTAPEAAALAILRQRAHAHTRQQLELPPADPSARLPELSLRDHAAFVGRVFAEQVQLSKPRQGDWPARRIDAALSEGMTLAVAETLEIMHESGQLDVATWRAVASALAEWSAKVARVAQGE